MWFKRKQQDGLASSGVTDAVEGLRRNQAEDQRRRERARAAAAEAKEREIQQSHEQLRRQNREINNRNRRIPEPRADPLISRCKIRELLQDLQRNLWKCGDISTLVVGASKQVQLSVKLDYA